MIKKSVLILGLLMLMGCSNEESSTGDCLATLPTNLELVSYEFLVNVELAWDAIEGVSYEVEYGHSGFTQGTGVIVSSDTNMLEINGLDFNVAYDFYLRSVCGEDTVSDWVGPVSNTPDGGGQTQALMTANINGTQYNYMVPFTWNIFSEAVNTVVFADDPMIYLWIQGNTDPGNTSNLNSKEINLYIPESLWAEGTYVLDNNYINMNQENQCHVNIIYNDSSTPTSQAFEDDNGVITITEFNLEDKIIRGTFEFTFDIHYTNSTNVDEDIECLNGTFEYSLDDSYFD